MEKEINKQDMEQSTIEEEADLELLEAFEDDEEWEREKEQRRKVWSRIRIIVTSLIVVTLVVSSAQLLFHVFNIPSIKFLSVSRQLTQDEIIQEYKKAVVTIENGNRKGTGFNISPDGLIVTNKHVIDEDDMIFVHFSGYGSYVGKILYQHPNLDLALVEIDGENFPTLTVSTEENWQKFIGEDIVFIGNPLAHSHIANTGTVTGEVHLSSIDVPVMEFTAPVYKGNSGSPVINKDGEVIGVLFATLRSSHSKDSQIRAVAVPAIHIIEVLNCRELEYLEK